MRATMKLLLAFIILCALVTGVQAEETDSAAQFTTALPGSAWIITMPACHSISLSNRDTLTCVFEGEGIIPAMRCTRVTPTKDERCEIVFPITNTKIIRVWDTKTKEWAW